VLDNEKTLNESKGFIEQVLCIVDRIVTFRMTKTLKEHITKKRSRLSTKEPQ